MKANIQNERIILIVRDENDKPQIIADINDRPKNSREYNSRRKNYSLSFDTREEAEKVLKTILAINDFDKAAAYLDKQ